MRKSLMHYCKMSLFITTVMISSTNHVFSIGAKTLDTTLSGTDKSQFIDNIWTFTSGDDYAKGFVDFLGGIELLSATPSYTVDIGISGIIGTPISLNGNTLRLTNDLRLGSLVRVNGPGFINLNGHTLRPSSQLQFNSGATLVYAGALGGAIVGTTNTIIQFFSSGLMRLNLPFYPSIGLGNLTFLNVTTEQFVTSSGSVNFVQDVEFVVNEGNTLEIFGEIDQLDLGYLRFTGNGSTVIRHHDPLVFAFNQMSGQSRLEIGNGVTYITNELFITTGGTAAGGVDETKIILDNATYIADGNNLNFDKVSFEIHGKSRLGSRNDGMIRLHDAATLRIFPGATLEIDDNMLLQLGAP